MEQRSAVFVQHPCSKHDMDWNLYHNLNRTSCVTERRDENVARTVVSSSQWRAPTGVTSLSDGTIVVTDTTQNTLTWINASGQVVRTLSGITMSPGQTSRFRTPSGLCSNAEDQVIVCDRGNNRLVILSRDGLPLQIVQNLKAPVSVSCITRPSAGYAVIQSSSRNVLLLNHLFVPISAVQPAPTPPQPAPTPPQPTPAPPQPAPAPPQPALNEPDTAQDSIRRFALVIGCNYSNVPSARLQGCGNDAIVTIEMLRQRRYEVGDIVLMTDDPVTAARLSQHRVEFPTKANILKEIQDLVQRVNQWTSGRSDRFARVVLQYSGHGDLVRDVSGDEKTGMDSTIVPNDFQRSGMILDDEIHAKTVRAFVGNVAFVFWSDSCHSGTVLDLPLVSESVNVSPPLNVSNPIGVWALSISGCRDEQTSADALFTSLNRWQGAMSISLVNVIKSTRPESVSCSQLADLLRAEVVRGGFTQRPQLCCSQLVNPRKDVMFPFL